MTCVLIRLPNGHYVGGDYKAGGYGTTASRSMACAFELWHSDVTRYLARYPGSQLEAHTPVRLG